MATTQIKRLFQNNTEFVPITLSEAVVVNTDNLSLMNGQGITTLDKVLSIALSTVGGTITDINTLEQAVATINQLLSEKQDKLTPGTGITITNGVISATGSSVGLYEIITGVLPDPSANYLNKIILHPGNAGTTGNVYEEIICIEKNGAYFWEILGSFQTTVDLENYVTKEEYNAKISSIETSISNINTALSSTITAQNVKVNNKNVVVNYTFTDSAVYGSMVGTNDDDFVQS